MEGWQPVCANCGAFDSLTWAAPDVEEIEMLPGAAHDERLAADAAHVFIARPGDSSAQPRLAQRKAATGGPGPAFVELPRPPDDPGPGHDGGIFETEASTDEGGL